MDRIYRKTFKQAVGISQSTANVRLEMVFFTESLEKRAEVIELKLKSKE